MAFIPPFRAPEGVLDRVAGLDPQAADLALVALVGLSLGAIAAAHHQRWSRHKALILRLDRLQRCAALLDEAAVRCIEIEDRYTHPELRGVEHQSALLTLRRDLARCLGEARSLIEAYGDLHEPRLAAEALAIAERPVFVANPDAADVERSLPELRRLCARLRNDQLETITRLRRQLDRRAWRKVMGRR